MMDIMDYHELMPGAKACAKHFVNVTEGDKVLIITDKPMIAEALAKASKKEGGEVMVVYLPRVMRPVEKLSEALKSIILRSTVVFTPFDAKREEFGFRQEILKLDIADGGRKIAHMSSVTPNMFSSPGMLSLNSQEIQRMQELTEKLAILLSAAKEIKIQSAIHKETNLSLDLGGWSHSGIVSTGDIRKGSWGNLPSGEAFVVPKTGTASGTIVIDTAISELPSNDLPVTLRVTNGIIELDSIKNGETLKDLLKRYPNDARKVCEFGVGTNPKHSFTLAPIEIEKILRTIHIGIGKNAEFGGDITASVPHTDMVINRPTVTVHDFQSREIKIIEEGTIMEDRLDAFFKVHYMNFKEKLSGSATIKVVPGVRVEDKEDMLYRCWSDYRGHELRIAVGDDDTARKIREIWDCIESTRTEEVRNILKKFNEKIGGDSELVYQLLNTLEKFGIIEIEPSVEPERRL